MIFSIETSNSVQRKLNAYIVLTYFCLMGQFFTNIFNVENAGIACACMQYPSVYSHNIGIHTEDCISYWGKKSLHHLKRYKAQ